MKRILLWLAFFGVIGLFIWALVQGANKTKVAPGTLSAPVTVADWSRGSSSPKVTLVEYSDFQCPACGAYHDIVKNSVDTYSKDVVFVYRHFPLIQIHKNADYAALSAEAAGKQGKFWEMHDMLFKTQPSWSDSNDAQKIFSGFAKELGLDVKKFESDMNSRELRQAINDDYKTGVSSGVVSTPTFFLNGKKIENPRSEEMFKTIIKNAIASSTTI